MKNTASQEVKSQLPVLLNHFKAQMLTKHYAGSLTSSAGFSGPGSFTLYPRKKSKALS